MLTRAPAATGQAGFGISTAACQSRAVGLLLGRFQAADSAISVLVVWRRPDGPPLGPGLIQGSGATACPQGQSLRFDLLLQSCRRHTYATLEELERKPGAAGKAHLFSVSRAKASRSLCPGPSPLSLMMATLVTLPCELTSKSNSVVPSAPYCLASFG